MRTCVDLITGLVVALLVLTILNWATGRLPGSATLLVALLVVGNVTILRRARRHRQHVSGSAARL